MNNVSLLAIKNIKDVCRLTEQDMYERLNSDAAAIFHLSAGGSRTRAKICIHACNNMGLSEHNTVCAASAIELLHNASLVHDDLQDGDESRRGQPTVWKKFGKARAICTGDAMINAAYAAIGDIDDPIIMQPVLREVTQAVAETIAGQSQDLDKSIALDSKAYEHIAAQKSGPLFRLGLSLPMIMAGRSDLLGSVNYIAAKFAIAYQIHDDIGDWESDKLANTMNIVSILAEQSDIDEAIFIAKNRVKYLLMLCKKELAVFPNDSAAVVCEVADQLLNSVESLG
jgi:geranylgeranyl diphosphate synthase type II